jgi:hypothetical protein
MKKAAQLNAFHEHYKGNEAIQSAYSSSIALLRSSAIFLAPAGVKWV